MQPTPPAPRPLLPSSGRRRVRQIALAAVAALCLAAYPWCRAGGSDELRDYGAICVATFVTGPYVFRDITGSFTLDPDTLPSPT